MRTWNMEFMWWSLTVRDCVKPRNLQKSRLGMIFESLKCLQSYSGWCRSRSNVMMLQFGQFCLNFKTRMCLFQSCDTVVLKHLRFLYIRGLDIENEILRIIAEPKRATKLNSSHRVHTLWLYSCSQSSKKRPKTGRMSLNVAKPLLLSSFFRILNAVDQQQTPLCVFFFHLLLLPYWISKHWPPPPPLPPFISMEVTTDMLSPNDFMNVNSCKCVSEFHDHFTDWISL